MSCPIPGEIPSTDTVQESVTSSTGGSYRGTQDARCMIPLGLAHCQCGCDDAPLVITNAKFFMNSCKIVYTFLQGGVARYTVSRPVFDRCMGNVRRCETTWDPEFKLEVYQDEECLSPECP